MKDELFRLAVEASPSAMIMIDAEGKIVLVNKETKTIFGYSEKELIGQNFHILVPVDLVEAHSKMHKDFVAKLQKRKMGIGTKLFAIKKNGREFPVEIGLNPIKYKNEIYVLCGINDLTAIDRAEFELLKQKGELEEANKKLGVLASTDPLTGLFNRRVFFQELELILNISHREDVPISLIMFDLDDFKTLNDKLGHQHGDEALSMVANTIHKTIRKSDVAARYGGEEFCIILPHTDVEGSVFISERMRKSINDKKIENYKISASFGMSTFKFSKKGRINVHMIMNQIIAEADQALFASKRNGKNVVTHYKNI